MKLRPHQELAIQMCRESFARGNKRIVLAAPTSFGKTITAISMLVSAAQKGKRAIFICDRVKLIDQTVETCERYGIKVGVMQGQHWMTDPSKQIQIASIQTLARRWRMAEFDFAVVDECHTHYAYLTEMMQAYSAVCFIGLSATPYSKNLGRYYDDLIVPITPRELLDQGYLCPVRYYGGHKIDTTGMKRRSLSTGGTDFDPKDLARATEDDKTLTGDIVQNWIKWGENSQTIAFSPSIKHSKFLVEMFRSEAGVSAEHIDGYMPPEEREQIFAAHDAGEFKILSCSRLLNTGYDAPSVRCLIDAFPTSSLISYQQRAGRIFRTHPGKEYAIYLDHAGNLRHGFAEDLVPDKLDDGSEKRFDERNQVKEKKEPSAPRDCPQCYQQTMIGLRCQSCGHEIPVTKRIETDSTMLEEVKVAKKANKEWSYQDKAKFLGELQHYAQTRGYNPNWASHKYREKLGVWPNKIEALPANEVSDSTMGWLKHKQIAWAKRRRVA